MKIRIYYIVIILSFIFFLNFIAGCGTEMLGPNSNIVFPDSLISYTNNVEPFIRVKCSYVGCHCQPPNNGYNASDMSTYFSLFSSDNLSLVIPGNPDGSNFIQIMERKLPHNYYIFPQGYFTQNHIDGMRKWIKEGAKLQ